MKAIGTYPNLRMRRNRKADWVRRLVSEHNLSSNDLILPLFIKEGKKKKEIIDSMPNVFRYSVDELKFVVEKACKLKIPLLALFPYTSSNKKNNILENSLDEIAREIKFRFKLKWI